MPFEDAEATDARLDGVPALLREAVAKADYRRNPHQIFDNMDSDPQIGDLPEADKPASRIELLEVAAVHRADQAEMRDEAVLYCRSHQQEGPPYPDAANITFGRVNRFRSLVNAIADSDSALGVHRAEALLRDVIHDAPPATRLERQRSSLAGRILGSRQMWCYPAGDAANPFAEIGNSRIEAVNVLGLGWYAYDAPDDELVRWAHMLPDAIGAYLPTAWDADDSVYWRPGGRTYRLDRDDYGVPEVVHNPVAGDNLTAPIYPIL